MANAQPRRIVYLPLDEITEAKVNPKEHDLGRIESSIVGLGFIEPMVRDERTGLLVSGHGRLEVLVAAEAAGLAPPDGITTIKGRWRAPVVVGWSSEDDDHAALAIFNLNDTGRAAGYDPDLLGQLLSPVRDDLLPVIGHDRGTLGKILDVRSSDVTEGYRPAPPELGADDVVTSQYGVIIVCADEEEQIQCYEAVRELGYGIEVRVVVT